MQPGLVSIMMPAYNAQEYIGLAIESVLAQSYSHWELVIVDDGSKDRTAEIASRYTDYRIRFVHQENRGEAAARNTALMNIQGELLAFLDADDVYLPHHLETMASYLFAQSHLDGVYSDGYYIDHTGKQLRTLSSRRRGPFEGHIFEHVVYGSDVFGPPACVVLRAKLIDRHKLKFDENIVIGPDWDFFTRYSAFARFGYINQHSCLYRVHTTNISVRVSLEKRALELSKCRMNAIKLKDFAGCSIGVRVSVFYDLLINLLAGFPEKQSEVTRWIEFTSIPEKEQARLLRLMASKTIVRSNDQSHVQSWLDRARQLNPADWRTIVMVLLFSIDPNLLFRLLRIKGYRDVDPRRIPPFADMDPGNH